MIELVNGLEHREEIRALFTEYTDMLVETDPTFARYLVLQSYDDELQHLEVKYGPPRGRLWLRARRSVRRYSSWRWSTGRPPAASRCIRWTTSAASSSGCT